MVSPPLQEKLRSAPNRDEGTRESIGRAVDQEKHPAAGWTMRKKKSAAVEPYNDSPMVWYSDPPAIIRTA